MFVLKILCSLWDFGKCLLINQKKFFATFVDTALLNGGLNKIIFWDLFFVFCWWFLVYLKSTLNPPFFRASSYSYFAVLNISSLEKFFDSVFWMEFGICFMTFGGYRILSFKHPGHLYIFFDFEVGVYWRRALNREGRLFKKLDFLSIRYYR